MSAPPVVLAGLWAAVAAALPAIRLELGASAAGALAVASVLLLTPAVLVAPAARLSHRAALAAGTLLLAIGAVTCALAGSIAVLAGGAVIAGAGAAGLLAPSASFASPALGGAAYGLALAAGPLAGAALAQAADWRWVFWLALPLTALAALAAAGLPRPDGRPTGDAATAALLGTYAAVALLVPQYGQFVLERTGVRSALLLLPAGAALLVLSFPAVWLAGRLGARTLVVAGLTCAAAGMLALTFVDADTGPRALLPGVLLLGVGLGLACPQEPLGPGWSRAALLAAGALVLTAGGLLSALVESARRDAGASFDTAVSDGLAGTAWLLAAVLVLGALLAAVPALQAKRVSSTPS